MTIEPLHVRVARALGWTECAPCPLSWGGWHGIAPADYWRDVCDYGNQGTCGCPHSMALLPPYGEESEAGWAVTGPLMAPNRISVGYYHPPKSTPFVHHPSIDAIDAEDGLCGAIASMICALHEAGRLLR
jgi:hypothetical protein